MKNTLANRRLQFEMDSEMQILSSKFKNRYGNGLTNKRLMKQVFKDFAKVQNIEAEEPETQEPEIQITYYREIFAT